MQDLPREFPSPTFSVVGEGELKFPLLELVVSLKFFDNETGISVTPKAYLESAVASMPPGVSFSAGVAADATAQLEILGKDIVDKEWMNVGETKATLLSFNTPEQDGEVECFTAPPPPPCNSCGDVHIRTPDGLAYDYQGAGEFL